MSKMDAAKQTGIDMAEARAKTSIDVALVREFLHNGPDKWKERSSIVNVLQNDPTFDKSQRDFMTRTERYHRGLSMTNRVYELQESHNWSNQQTATAFASLDEGLPISLHMIAFQPVFMSQGSPELIAKYGELIARRGILGCYLQTELGHGTNVARLETTATYIPETREFEINSPTLTSSKWWIGALGRTSTHGVVQAKLILPGGKDVGPHLFFVQLRNLEDHTVLPGIIIGDIGPKALAGNSPNDNGFAKFDHIRIPKENMLSKFAQVTDDGQYVQPPHSKLSYGGMMYIRANMVTGAGWLMAKAATVAIRYASVRRQGELTENGLERQIIQYPSVYIRLLPILSHAYVFTQLGDTLMKTFNTMSSRLASGDTSMLPEMHATTSGLKVMVSSLGVQDLEVARRSMGGHGYSAFAGLGRLYADYLPSVTYEGDNFVLDQQVVRAALKSFRTLFSTKTPSTSSLSPSSYYLRLLIQPATLPPELTEASWKDPSIAALLLEWRAALMVYEHAQTSSDPDASVNQRVSKGVTEAFIGSQVLEIIKELPLLSENGRVVSKLYLLYLLTTVEGGLVDLLSFGLFRAPSNTESGSRDPARSLRLAIKQLCLELLPNAIGLSDVFGFTDWELDSALGVYDGKVYDALWRCAQGEPLNQKAIPAAYEFLTRHTRNPSSQSCTVEDGKLPRVAPSYKTSRFTIHIPNYTYDFVVVWNVITRRGATPPLDGSVVTSPPTFDEQTTGIIQDTIDSVWIIDTSLIYMAWNKATDRR
ncbi:acyl-CoA dehydrogenase/oxidase C-terminal [Collybia nuda]|uniref:Acyl-coenzyme A oxidase n=1 Tax=Collybia nuda TaxID=64659 RepID=A0A9P6CD44_9AGAR|nr:acyl-CoA dehydrogenase/oxidase C-terminal [Collybia nuda]